MKELNLEEIKEIELKILKNVHRICEKNSFRYSLAYGTLLGAIRHKGFIPWDDDIDIFMPRDDYNRFVEFCNNNKTPFKLRSIYSNDGYYSLYAKAVDTNTKLVFNNNYCYDYNLGIYIDIFPVDGLGNSIDEAINNIKKTKFKRAILVASNWRHYFKSKNHAWYMEPIRLLFYIISRFINQKKLAINVDNNIRRISYDNSNYCACVGEDTGDPMPKHFFEEYVDLKFENEMFKATKYYNDYLKNNYGDYMKLPPENKRISMHDFKAYIIDKKNIL